MNSKGQLLYGIFILILFGIFWIAGLSTILNSVGEASGATGLWGFAVSNLNLVVGFFYVISWGVVLKWG